MTSDDTICGGPVADELVREKVRSAGHEEARAGDFARLEQTLFQFIRMTRRGEVPRQLLAELDLDLDLPHFHALGAVRRITAGIGRPAPEDATVGLLAEEMEIDPSRASRLAADLIARGHLVRGAAQSDGRKSVLHLTPEAERALEAFRAARWDRMMSHMKAWSGDEVETFALLFARFVEGGRRAYDMAP